MPANNMLSILQKDKNGYVWSGDGCNNETNKFILKHNYIKVIGNITG